MSPVYFFIFIVTAGINSIAQLLLKKGSLDLSNLLSSHQSLVLKAVKVFLNPFVFTAATLLASGMALWIYVISKVELSRAYTINIGLTILFTTIAAFFIFNEPLTLSKVCGGVLIIAGIFFMFNY